MPKLWAEEEHQIDLSNINPNKIFTMSYNFELLKYVITSLIHNQQNMDNHINDLKLSSLKQQKHSYDLELSIIEQKIQREETPEDLEELLKKKKEIKEKNEEINKEIESIINKIEEEKDKKKIDIYEMKNKNQEIEQNKIESLNEEIIPSDIQSIEKIDRIEKDKDKENISKINENINDKENEINEEKEGELQKNEIDKESENKEIEKKEEEIKEEKKEEIKEEKEEEKKQEKEEEIKEEKIMEKPRSITSSKIKEKEKEKNKNEEIHKELQLIVGELKNIKSKQQILEKDFSLFKLNTTEKIKEKLGTEIPSMINNTFDSKILLIQKNTKKEFDKINEDINDINNNFEQKLSDLKNNISKEISLNDEKNNIELEQIKNNYLSLKENLSLINEKLSNMVTTLTFNNLKKEILEKIEEEKKIINLEISITKSSLNGVKNQVLDHLSDSRDHDNLVSLMKIMDNISSHIQKLMDFKKALEEKDKRKAIVENSKYVKQEGFNEAMNNIHKYMDNNKKEFSEIRLDIDSIKSKDLNVKANLRDLKNLEDSIFIKMEALKETIRDKFVEKNMLIKNLKFLEIQTKQLIEENKKTEKKESWLLAKKPIDPHLCASCEAYLGDLKPNTNSKFVAWNKYPAKETIEKVFRINAGFSKVLQMVNQDRKERSKSNSLNNSKVERNCSSEERDKQKMEKIPNYKNRNRYSKIRQNNSSTQIDDNELVGTLPKISMKKSNKASSDNIFYDQTNKTINGTYIKSRKLVEENESEKKINKIENEEDDENKEFEKPKITKVYRKIADNKDKKDDKDKV